MTLDRTFSVAPMMEWTDTHYRNFARIMTKHTLLYTEMVTAPALVHGNVDRHLHYNDTTEHPIAVQLGGGNPDDLATATQHCHRYGYDEINLNVGCPSNRVQNGKIGAILMAEPDTVAQCVSAMADNTDKPVTVKHRIGLDTDTEYDVVKRFVEIVAQNSPCTTFIVHARNAILKGLSPKENRDIPPLKYDYVYQLKKDFPELEILINGGITTLPETQNHLHHIDGVMMGRSAYQTPYDSLIDIDRTLYNVQTPVLQRSEVISAFIPYMQIQLNNGIPLGVMAKHILGTFHGCKGGKQFRRHLAENMFSKDAGISVIEDAVAYTV